MFVVVVVVFITVFITFPIRSIASFSRKRPPPHPKHPRRRVRRPSRGWSHAGGGDLPRRHVVAAGGKQPSGESGGTSSPASPSASAPHGRDPASQTRSPSRGRRPRRAANHRPVRKRALPDPHRASTIEASHATRVAGPSRPPRLLSRSPSRFAPVFALPHVPRATDGCRDFFLFWVFILGTRTRRE